MQECGAAEHPRWTLPSGASAEAQIKPRVRSGKEVRILILHLEVTPRRPKALPGQSRARDQDPDSFLLPGVTFLPGLGTGGLNRSLNFHSVPKDKGVPQPPAGDFGDIAEPQPPRLRRGQPPGSPGRAGFQGHDITEPLSPRSRHPGAAPRCYSNTKPLHSVPGKGERLVST